MSELGRRGSAAASVSAASTVTTGIMRIGLLTTAMLLALAGCHDAGADANNLDANGAVANDASTAVPTDIPSMLKAGTPQLCTNDEIEKTLFSALSDAAKSNDDVRASLGLGLFTADDLALAIEQTTLSLDAVTFEGADPQLARVSCNGNLIVHGGGSLDKDVTKAVDYEVRASLTPGEPFVISSNADSLQDEYQQDIMQLARQNAIDRLNAANQATAQQAAPPAQTNSPSAEVPGTLPKASPDGGADINQQ